MSAARTDHGFTPSTSPFSDGTSCRVMLARYPCPFTKDEHDPDLPPVEVEVDVFGYRRGRFTTRPPTTRRHRPASGGRDGCA